MAMAAATSPDVKHPRLELLFTLDEEDGMTGAKALTPESFRGRTMLNLDTEEDDYLLIGCAGGCDTVLTWSLGLTPIDSGDEVVRVSVTGLRGGHSGCDIVENRGNAVKLLTQTLLRGGVYELSRSTPAASEMRSRAREMPLFVDRPDFVIVSLLRPKRSRLAVRTLLLSRT